MCVCVCVRQREKYGNFRIKYFQNQSELFLWITTNYYRLLFSFSLSFFFHRFSLASCYAIPCNRGGEKNCKFQVILYARFESDRYRYTEIHHSRPRSTDWGDRGLIFIIIITNERKERTGGEENRIEPTVREPTTFDIQEETSLLAPIRRAPWLLLDYLEITRRSRPPPIDIFHFLLHLSFENILLGRA